MKSFRHTLLGIGLIALALYVLFENALGLPTLQMPLWLLILVVGFGYDLIKHLFLREWRTAAVEAIFLAVLLNSHYQWLAVGFWTMLLVMILLIMGIHYLIPKKRHSRIKVMERFSKDLDDDPDVVILADDDEKASTVFGGSTRYVTGDFVRQKGDLVFGNTTIYFENAVILGDKASYEGDLVFSSLKLYVPSNWRVVYEGDKVFSTVKIPHSRQATDKTLVVQGDLVFSTVEVIYL